ncbi:hypothetical protein [Sanyastnella coralliicola]|uniref:hypothetical protein n=1 Tax=Sanyastnella coralliicola TaxID=3069118 RepID=UPI0027BA65DB|nr:hypothetical protein [Longitalea sp. SCSIO 12813]
MSRSILIAGCLLLSFLVVGQTEIVWEEFECATKVEHLHSVSENQLISVLESNCDGDYTIRIQRIESQEPVDFWEIPGAQFNCAYSNSQSVFVFYLLNGAFYVQQIDNDMVANEAILLPVNNCFYIREGGVFEDYIFFTYRSSAINHTLTVCDFGGNELESTMLQLFGAPVDTRYSDIFIEADGTIRLALDCHAHAIFPIDDLSTASWIEAPDFVGNCVPKATLRIDPYQNRWVEIYPWPLQNDGEGLFLYFREGGYDEPYGFNYLIAYSEFGEDITFLSEDTILGLTTLTYEDGTHNVNVFFGTDNGSINGSYVHNRPEFTEIFMYVHHFDEMNYAYGARRTEIEDPYQPWILTFTEESLAISSQEKPHSAIAIKEQIGNIQFHHQEGKNMHLQLFSSDGKLLNQDYGSNINLETSAWNSKILIARIVTDNEVVTHRFFTQ